MATRKIGVTQNLTGTAETSDEFMIRRRAQSGWKHGYMVKFTDVGDGSIAIEWAPDNGVTFIPIKTLGAITVDEVDNIEPVSERDGRVRFVLSGGTTADIIVGIF